MKITRSLLKEIIKEEIQKELSEQDYTSMYGGQRSYDPGMSMARQTPASPEDLEVGKPKKQRFKVSKETMMMQAMLNLALDELGNPLPYLELDGQFGPKTREVLRLVKRKLGKKTGIAGRRGESLLDGLARLTGMSREDLKDHATTQIAELGGIDTLIDIGQTVDDLKLDPKGLAARLAGKE